MFLLHSRSIFLFFAVMISLPFFHQWAQSQERVFPEPPILLEPPNGATISIPRTDFPLPFQWSPVTGATRYEINIRVGNIPRPPVEVTETTANVNLNLTNNDNHVVFWSVRSGNEDGFSSQFQSFSFIVSSTGAAIPTPIPTPTPFSFSLTQPELKLPEDGANIDITTAASSNINFDWSDVFGADKFILTIYRDNEIERQVETGVSQLQRVRIDTILFDVFQWDVTAVQNRTGSRIRSERFSFSIGAGFLPTPTPIPFSADINRDQEINARDVFVFASVFLTNDSTGDLDNSGITNTLDMLHFLERFASNQ